LSAGAPRDLLQKFGNGMTMLFEVGWGAIGIYRLVVFGALFWANVSINGDLCPRHQMINQLFCWTLMDMNVLG
jgi:hypothetical protein